MNKDVFISYSTKNENIANLVVKTLESQGMSCWIAPRDIPAGKDYAQCILEAIADSKVMVVVFSAQSNISVFVQREIERAIHYNSTIIPFKIENIFPTESMEFYLSTVQWLDAWQPPKEKYLIILSDRVKQLLMDPKLKSKEKISKTISTKQRKAFDLAYNEEKKNKNNVPHAAFWLGSRYLPSYDIFEDTRNVNIESKQMLDKALFGMFGKYEKQLGFNSEFNQFFDHIFREKDFNMELAIRAKFLDKMFILIENRYGEKIEAWWALGISLSTLWYWTSQKRNKQLNSNQNKHIQQTINSINTILGIMNPPSFLKNDFIKIRDNSEMLSIPKSLNAWLIDWTALIEMYLLIDEYEISRENAEILIEINPELATIVLQQYLKEKPNDGEALMLIGKASLKTFSKEICLEPLYRTDPVSVLTWSMKKSISLNPNSEWSNRARFILDKINAKIN